MSRVNRLVAAVTALALASSVSPAVAEDKAGGEAPPPTSPAAPEAPPDATAPAQPDPANKPAAEEAFKKGLSLLGEEAWAAALAEFLRSRELFPTRTATNNAAVCLRKLKRFDESLDMYVTLLREFPNMPEDKKVAAQKELSELQQLVGTIDVIGAEPGASIIVDGKPRQDFPLLDPLRVSAGTHTVRLFKEGFQPFEKSIDVAGGQSVKITAKMPALVASGRLRVAEKGGKRLEVVVDGAAVGVTPWEGSVAVGDHVVFLRGDGDLGSQPTAAPVKQGDVTILTLASEPLESSVLVNVSPVGASVRIDGVPVGRGVWDGRLRKGAHVVEATYDGYFAGKREVSLERGEHQELKLTLERDEDADRWRKPSKIMFDVSGGVALSPSFGGDVGSSCGEGCTNGAGIGGLVMLHGAYEFGSGFGIGLGGGFLQASQTVENRVTTINPVGLDPGLGGTATDDLRLRGYLVGVDAGMRFFEDFPVRLRLGAGALIAQARAVRTGSFTTRSGSTFRAPELTTEQVGAFVYLDPEVSIGWRFADLFEIGAGVQALVLIAAAPPTWGGDENPSVVIEGDGLSSYEEDETTMGHMVLFVPGLNARVAF